MAGAWSTGSYVLSIDCWTVCPDYALCPHTLCPELKVS